MSKMRTVRGLLVALALLLVAAVGLTNQACKQPPQATIKVGAIMSLTGPWATLGVDTEKGFRVFFDMLNEGGGIKGHPVEYVVYDDASDPTKAVLDMKQLIDMDKVHFVIGPNTTAASAAVRSIAEEKKTPFAALIATEGIIDRGYAYGFKFVALLMGAQVDQVAWPIKCGGKTLAALYADSQYGRALLSGWESLAGKYGIPIVAKETYDPSATDFGAQLARIKAANPGGLMVGGAEMAGGLAIKQAREMGIVIPTAASITLASASILKVVGQAYSISPGVYVSGTVPDVWQTLPKDDPTYPNLERVTPFAAAYIKKYNEDIDFTKYMPVPAGIAFKEAVERALDNNPGLFDQDLATIRSKIRDEIEKTNTYLGLGKFTLTPTDHHGQSLGTSGYVGCQIQNGTRVYVPGSRPSDLLEYLNAYKK